MRFSELFGITRDEHDTWFDPILTVDTPLFIDPFLIYANESGVFRGSHEEIISYFNCLFRMVARGRQPGSYDHHSVPDLLSMGEVAEICLGYTARGTRGSGTGAALARNIRDAIECAIGAGLEEGVRHFEELALFGKLIAEDRISDMTAHVLLHRLADYTAEACTRHGVRTRSKTFPKGRFSVADGCWIPLTRSLPTNPTNDKPILLVPKCYLRDLPTITADGFWQYCYDNEKMTLRQRFGEDIARRVDKPQIIELARDSAYRELLDRYIASVEAKKATPYDLRSDPKRLLSWYEDAVGHCCEHPVPLGLAHRKEFDATTVRLLEEFVCFVTAGKGRKHVCDEWGNPQDEEMLRRLLQAVIGGYCRAAKVGIDKEWDIGTSVVEFRRLPPGRSQGFRTLLLVKGARDDAFWNGFPREWVHGVGSNKGVKCGYVVVFVTSTDVERSRLDTIRGIVRSANASLDHKVRVAVGQMRPAGTPAVWLE